MIACIGRNNTTTYGNGIYITIEASTDSGTTRIARSSDCTSGDCNISSTCTYRSTNTGCLITTGSIDRTSLDDDITNIYLINISGDSGHTTDSGTTKVAILFTSITAISGKCACTI